MSFLSRSIDDHNFVGKRLYFKKGRFNDKNFVKNFSQLFLSLFSILVRQILGRTVVENRRFHGVCYTASVIMKPKASVMKYYHLSLNVSAALRRMKAGDLEQEDQNLKCYLKCFMMRHGILDKNAEVDVQRALRHLPRSMQDSSKKLFNKCKSVREYFTPFRSRCKLCHVDGY